MKPPDDENQMPLFGPEPPPEKPSLLDAKAAREAAEDGIYRATFLTDHDEKHAMYEAGCNVARRLAEFTVDEIWDEIGQVGTWRDDGSGIGPVMRELQADGVIEQARDAAGGIRFRKSRRPPTHCRPLTVWRSRIYNPPSTEPAHEPARQLLERMWPVPKKPPQTTVKYRSDNPFLRQLWALYGDLPLPELIEQWKKDHDQPATDQPQ